MNGFSDAFLGIELGSTRIKACLIGDDPWNVVGTGTHQWGNRFVDGLWTYSLDAVWEGIQAAYADLVADVERRFGTAPRSLGAIGISAMMHGYLAFDEAGNLLVPFRTWRNTNTEPAAQELTKLFELNIPLRWSVAHLHQAVRDAEEHVSRIRSVNTLAGYVHERLTGRRVLGIGDASGMFPIDPATHDYDAKLLARYDCLVTDMPLSAPLRDLLPEVLVAGEPAGELTAAGAHLIDPTGTLQPGAVFAPPEGDAGTGMVATNAIDARTGNVSAGTSIFAMVVLERPLHGVHREVDLVATPAGDPVAMVHCNNGGSEVAAWAEMFERFAAAVGAPVDPDSVYETLFLEALKGDADAGGVLAYNHLSGEPIVGLSEGRPLVVHRPNGRLTLANLMRAQLYGVFSTLVLGMRVLNAEGVALDRMYAHGGLFRTQGVAQRLLAGALNTPVAAVATAPEGGAWGMAILAKYIAGGRGQDLASYLREQVFAGPEPAAALPDPDDVAGFSSYLDRYCVGLGIERAAIDTFIE